MWVKRAQPENSQITAARQEITGANTVHRLYAGNGKPAGFSGYFVIQFDRPFKVGLGLGAAASGRMD